MKEMRIIRVVMRRMGWVYGWENQRWNAWNLDGNTENVGGIRVAMQGINVETYV